MKYLLNVTVIAYLAVVAAISVSGQQVSGTSKARSDSKSSAAAGRELVSAGTVTNAELTNTVDVRKSKVGDQVVLKTTKAIKQNGETAIAKGTKLMGRITEIQQKTKENGQSKIAMLFDRIDGKNIDAPISLSILSMTNTRASANAGDSVGGDLMSSSSTSASSSSGSGGLVGGVTNTVGGVLNTTTQTAGNVVGGATQTVGNTAGTLGRTVNGIQISQSAGGSASGSTMLSSGNKNLRIEKGVTFNVQFNSSVQN